MKNFPMFLKMAGRRVLILGGGEEAAQKTRLMLKTEAEIVVIADVLNAELNLYADDGKIMHTDEPLSAQLLRSAILVFSATGCAGAGAAHATLAKATNTLINVVDMPELCEAITPSIVDRDPLVVAIGTEGCAPILGRQIKSKIETILEPNLGDLVAFAGRLRAQVSQNVAQNRRREFWNWVFKEEPRRKFRNGSTKTAFRLINEALEKRAENIGDTGGTSFVQSLSGEPEQLKLRDISILQEADIVYFEQGLHEDILEFARRDAKRVSYVGNIQMLDCLKKVESKFSSTPNHVSIITKRDFSKRKC